MPREARYWLWGRNALDCRQQIRPKKNGDARAVGPGFQAGGLSRNNRSFRRRHAVNHDSSAGHLRSGPGVPAEAAPGSRRDIERRRRGQPAVVHPASVADALRQPDRSRVRESIFPMDRLEVVQLGLAIGFACADRERIDFTTRDDPAVFEAGVLAVHVGDVVGVLRTEDRGRSRDGLAVGKVIPAGLRAAGCQQRGQRGPEVQVAARCSCPRGAAPARARRSEGRAHARLRRW